MHHAGSGEGLETTDGIVGADPALRATLDRARLVAPTRTPVLVMGESGTGKELVARLLHRLGPDPRGPYVAVNCGALPRELAESELFGHERGAFTGAAGQRRGWFEEAAGGTLVLDEIGELPLDLQPKLLRVLETGCLRRVGGAGEIAVRVRVVAMTLRDLGHDARRGAFRLDLYHRLAGFELRLPPLRRRRGDMASLARHLLDEMAGEFGPRALTALAIRKLEGHEWPGNVRELRNVLRRAALLTPDSIDADAIEIDEGACGVAADAGAGNGRWASHAADGPASDPPAPAAPGLASTVLLAARPAGARLGTSQSDTLVLAGKRFEDLQREIFLWAMARSGGSRRRAAHALGISRSTFCDRVKRLGLRVDATPATGCG